LSNLSISSYWIFLFLLIGTFPYKTRNFICQQNKDENHDDKEQDFVQAESVKHEESTQGKSQNNLMSSFAEKALSVAGPVVPTKGDGEVDQERSVNVTVVFFLCHYIFSLFSVNALIMLTFLQVGLLQF
jgi:hypothetical protein